MPHDWTPTLWILSVGATVFAALVSAGVIGLWRLSNSMAATTVQMTALQATIASWTETFNTRFESLLVTTKEHSDRIGTVEGEVKLHGYQIKTLGGGGDDDGCRVRPGRSGR